MKVLSVLLIGLSTLFFFQTKEKTTIFLVGDSTVQNGSGKGEGRLWGWGAFFADQLDTTQVEVVNRARGGRSSRTFISEGLWDQVHAQIDSGDYVIIQFGHNDGGAINDDFRARGSIRGNGDEMEEIDNILTGQREMVRSYGWYIRKYCHDTKAKGGIPIVCSLVARNVWKDGKVDRATESYAKWAREAAKMEGAYFIDLNDLVATKYESLGQDYVTSGLFVKDHTHTNKEGAIINAKLVAEAIKELKDCGLGDLVK
ncbi:rhamnogalacturonan acetylesterase [Marinoscillum sp. MHG1-6]|uniref:rhamnogalacturonan acetylesterase n=1 Tax=Marinoscillum sp. MHG1-6 TaxID=2959627 RepID=UPI0021578E24|nr:rhamnogalacturonan acetylesterase [Marinoscillum sp. MHG1-6]